MNEQEKTNKLAQKIQLEIMDEVHSLCVKYGIKYYIIGGTALGAVRHIGFIPWDIDIDIAMPRYDYNLFVTKYSKKLNPSFACKNYFNTPNYAAPHAVVVKKGTKIVFNFDRFNNSGNHREVYIDIMPLDNPPASRLKMKQQEMSIKLMNQVRKFKMGKIYASDGCLKKAVKGLISLPFTLISWRSLNNFQDRAMSRFSLNQGNVLCSMASHFNYSKQCFDSSVYGKPTLYPFENRVYFGPEKIEFYLTRLYGNYMEFPSKETQTRLFNFIDSVSE